MRIFEIPTRSPTIDRLCRRPVSLKDREVSEELAPWIGEALRAAPLLLVP